MPSIDRAAYSDPTTLEAELDAIFFRRLFVGTRFDFLTPNAYRSLVLGRKALTLRRDGEDIRAYENVCLHRNALIDPPGVGERPFRCRYHGWSYDADGTLSDAPLADNNCITKRSLPRVPIAASDGLYFAGLRGIAPDVSEVSKALARAQIAMEAPFHRDLLHHDCNWKLLVENVLEGYHLSFVHGETFRPAGFTSTGNYSWDGGTHTSWNELRPTTANDKQAAMRRLSRQAEHVYRHIYVFPDLFVSNTNGLVGFLSHIVPKSATATQLEWMLFELPALKALPAALRTQIKTEAVAFTAKALGEDQLLVESCQSGMSCDGSTVQLQPCEGRIGHFHSLYAEHMQHG